MHTAQLRIWLLLMMSIVGWSAEALPSYRVTEHLLINGGLSNNYVRDMVLDDKGRLWVATESGLDVYDGADYRCYNSFNSPLSTNMVNVLWFDEAAHLLWVGTKGRGLATLDTETGQMSLINTPDSSLVNVRCILPEQRGRLWLVSADRLLLADRETGTVTPVLDDTLGHQFRCAIDDGHGNLLVGTHMSGTYLYNARTGQLDPLQPEGALDGRIKVNLMVKDLYGRIWIATNQGIWIYRSGEFSLKRFEHLGPREVFHLLEIDDQHLWYASNSNIWSIDLKSGEVSPVRIEDGQASQSGIQKIYRDPCQNIWIGGSGNGIDFISHEEPAFRRINDNPFWGIYAEGDTVWVGSKNEIMAYRGTELIQRVQIAQGAIYGGSVISINGDGADLLYLAVPYHMLSYNKKTGRIREITSSSGHSIEALTFYRQEDGTLWITANDGVYTLRDGTVTEVEGINRVLSRQSAHGVRQDRQGKIWVATYENGIYLFDPQYRLLCQLSQQTGFVSNSIQHLKFDSQGRLWMSTPDGPCCIPDTRYPDQYVSFGYKEGLRDTYVRAIQDDKEGNIWVSTNNGISMLRRDSHTFINYSQDDYLPVNNLIGGAVLLSDGALIFNSIEGLCYCTPSALTRPRRPAQVWLKAFQVLSSGEADNVTADVRPDCNGVYYLDHDRSSFRLVIGSRDYTESRQLEYEYHTGSSDDRWMPCYKGTVEFRNLQPGRYPIRIRVRVKGQDWHADDVLSVPVCIRHPWWSGIWARIVYLLLAGGVITLFLLHYRRRLRLKAKLDLVRRRNTAERERNAERLHFFTNITHELKTPLSLVLAPLEQLLEDKTLRAPQLKRIQLVYDSALRLSDLCNKLLDFRRAEMHNRSLHPTMGQLSTVINEVGQTFIALNSNPNLRIVVQCEEEERPMSFDADVVHTMIENLMSNAVKYTPAGQVSLSLHYETEGHAIIQVSDTGYGIAPEALPHIYERYYQAQGPHQASGTGIGLALVRSLVELHGAQISVESVVDQGTTFTVRLSDAVSSTSAPSETSVPLPASIPAAPDVEADTDPRPLLLLVEDDFQIVEFVANALADEYVVLRAYNGAEGRDLAFERIPDLIITDLMMPVMDGGTMCRTLKQDIRTCHIPIVMLTARDQQEDQLEGYENGADSYLTKPFSLKMLRSRLQNLLAARSRMAAWLNQRSLQQLSAALSAIGSEPAFPSQPEQEGTLSAYDRAFLDDISKYVIAHISTESIRMEDVATALRISHSTLYRKVKALTGLSGNEYLRKVRILHCARLMQTEHCNVSEAAFRCGFSSLPYFRNAFKEVFGMTPSEYMKRP